MADQGTQPHRFEVRPTSDSHFGWIRTRLSLERTLMSWVRTSVALIGFGFTIVQFFEHLHSEVVAPALRPQAPRYLGLALRVDDAPFVVQNSDDCQMQGPAYNFAHTGLSSRPALLKKACS